MQRHMQNVSFLVIVAVLLSCAFFVSQQTKADDTENDLLASTTAVVETRDDLPECGEELSIQEAVTCYKTTSELSEKLVDAKVDEILAFEEDTNRRMAFMDVQIAWEDARDTECAFIGDMAEEDAQAKIAEAACLQDQNLARLDQLNNFLCKWYDPANCSTSADNSD